jgi:uncharacterized protein YdaT
MPWTASSFKDRHNKSLRGVEAQRAADIANAILKKTGDEALAIRVANSKVHKSNYGKGK